MRATTLKNNLQLAIAVKRPAFVWGDPGIGKTEILRQVAKAMAFDGVLEWRLGLKDPVDLMGTPSIAKHHEDQKLATFWNPPAELPRSGRWVIFMDEFPQAKLDVQNAATSLILDRCLGSYTLPSECVIVAAGNHDANRAGTNKMPTQVASRFIHMTLNVHTGDWLEWAHEVGGIDPRVIAFIKYRPEYLQKFDPKSQEKAYACPRTWTYTSDVIKQADAMGMRYEAEEQLELIAGIVGREAAVDFIGFLRIMEKLVSIDSILLAPEKAALPEDSAVTYALTYALADRSDKKLLPTIAKYIERLQEEWQFLFFQEIKRKQEALMKTQTFIKWAAAHHDFA